MKNFLLLFLSILIHFYGFSQETNSSFDCSRIQTEKDKFKGTITFSTPLVEPITFHKYVEKGVTSYYLSLHVIGSTASVGETGVTILLSNGQKILKPNEKVGARVTSDGEYEYSAFIRLNATDIAKLKANSITDFELYIYDMQNIEGTKYKEMFNCLLTKK